MKDNQIITIGRQVGAGGNALGQELSKRLNIPFYDKEILAEASKNSGLTQELFEKHDEKSTGSFLYSLAMGLSSYGQPYQKPLMLELYLAQFETIKKLADQGPCIFIGRCSDYVLRDYKNAFHVFMNADLDVRAERIMSSSGVDRKKAEEMCIKGDKGRASYYNYYSNELWGDAKHYDLCINTTHISVDKAADIIMSCLE